MSEERAPSRFVWYDLMTTDPKAAETFYTAVVGWGTTVWDGPAPYTMWTVGEQAIGGTMQLPAEAVAQGARPHWLAYVSVANVAATVKRAQELGATVMKPATDIPSVGQYAVLNDPQGALFAVYKSLNEAPAEPAGPPPVGQFSWHELSTTDYEAAFAFYSELFGWEKTSAMDMGPLGVYQMFGPGGGIPFGGMSNKMPENQDPPAWLHYTRVPDINRAVEATKEHGGTVAMGPHEVPGGDWIVIGFDPQGGPFAVHQAGGSTKA
jgi:predicted enzyme related to lactoylglutathione lyase